MHCEVLFPLAAPGTYTYRVPAGCVSACSVGVRVLAPLGAGKAPRVGIVVQMAEGSAEAGEKIRDIAAVLDSEPLITAQQWDFWQWMAQYYMCTPGEVMKAAMPGALLKAEEKSRRIRRRRNAADAAPDAAPRPLSAAQQRALGEIHAAYAAGAKTVLLHGVTSSGKTEVYTHLIRETLSRGEQVLYLLPEIALTTQITQRLSAHFGSQMAVYHSRCTEAARRDLWRRQLSPAEAAGLVLGARSALFLPWQRLGLVLVDEEHEPSFKQQEPAPRYHARDAAIVLAQMCGAKALLGTATPSVETYRNAKSGKYALVEMPERFQQILLPEIVVEDVKELRRKRRMKSCFSPRLIDETRAALQKGQQAIFFQNRRGYAPVVQCAACSWTPRCAKCDVTLTLHRAEGRLQCHYCGASYPLPAVCPSCGGQDLRDLGWGTEKVLGEAQTLFPEAKIERLDLDTTRTASAYEAILERFATGETQILVGTQMVTKGLDFDGVHVVGILSADQMLSVPDFRATERAFQMMTQVAGRAGRKGERGLVILQTGEPESDVIRWVRENDFASMYRQQAEEREFFRFAPAVRLIYLFLKHRDEGVVEASARRAGDLLRPFFGEDLLGPERPAVSRVSMMHIRQLILKVDQRWSLSSVRRTLFSVRDNVLRGRGCGSVQFFFDVDPL